MKIFNVGDKARVRKDLVGGEMYDTCTSHTCLCNATMTLFAGYVVVVCGKNDITGIMHLRKVEDEFTTTMPFEWSDDMLEPLEVEEKQPHNNKAKKGFKVGDKVVIKTTVSRGEHIGHITIQPFMFDQAYKKSDMSHSRKRIGTVTRIVNDHDDYYAFKVSFEHDDREFTWPRDAFELYDGDNDKPKSPKHKKSVASTADYSGYTPKSEFYCYDYLNRPATFSKNAMENITKIEVTVMSGDETGCFYGVYNGKHWQYKFDTMTTSRFQSYDDGSYTVEGKENIEKWINWNYDTEKAIYAEYSMERMRAFRKRE